MYFQEYRKFLKKVIFVELKVARKTLCIETTKKDQKWDTPGKGLMLWGKCSLNRPFIRIVVIHNLFDKTLF